MSTSFALGWTRGLACAQPHTYDPERPTTYSCPRLTVNDRVEKALHHHDADVRVSLAGQEGVREIKHSNDLGNMNVLQRVTSLESLGASQLKHRTLYAPARARLPFAANIE